ncbi:MAG: GAF domain-containing protein [Thiobacillus sp.]|nr:GAF domain-containing protein [Thiobacillus sp.]
MGHLTGYAGLHDYNRAIRDIAASPDWQSGQFARQVRRVVEVAARFMGVSRVGVWRLRAGGEALDCLCQYDSRYGLVEPGRSLDANCFPAYFAALANNRALAASDALADARTAEMAESYLRPMRIASLLDAPIWLGGEVVGVVCHEHVGNPRIWRDEDIAFAGSMGDFAAMAMSQARYQRVEAARERLERIIEATPDMVAIMAPDGHLIQMNPAGRRLLGLSAHADISSYRSRDFLGEHTTYQLDTEIRPALFNAGHWAGEAVLREGTPQAMPVSVVALAHRDAQGNLEYFSVVLRDLTAQKTIQREIETLNHELEARVRARTQALETANRNLESFAYSVSHDLKAPLRGIAGYSRLLAVDYRDALPDEAREYVDLIRQASERMDRMIEDILAYSRVQVREMNPAPVGVREVVRRLLEEFEPQLRAGVELQQDVEPGVLETDRDGLMQILRNYLSNALKFSRRASPPRIRIEGRRQGAGYRFAVTDNGMGFDMRYHDRIFEIFHRLPNDDETTGTGIGLAIVARAAERLQGRVWAESEQGKRTTFYFEQPNGLHP